MANQLIFFDPSGIKATYFSSSRTLLVTAEGIVPASVLAPSFDLDTSVRGGRRLRIVSNIGGLSGNNKRVSIPPYREEDLGKPPWSSIRVVTLASPGANTEIETSIPVVIEPRAPAPAPVPTPPTAPTVIVPLRPQALPPLPIRVAADPNAMVLAAIPVVLPTKAFVRIVSPIPDPTVFRYTIEARGDPETIYVWRSGQTSDTIYWDLAWGDNSIDVQKGTFTVTTTKGVAGQTGGAVQITVQPYAVTTGAGGTKL